LEEKLKIKKILTAILAITILATPACGSDEDSKTLTVYSGRSEKLVGPIFSDFEATTGINLEIKYGSSNDLALAISTEGNKTQADVFLSRSPGPTGYLADLDMLANLDKTVLERVPVDRRSPNNDWVGFAGRARVLVYNTDEIATVDLPQSVFDLTDPLYKGLVAVPGSNSSFQDWFTVFRLRNGDDVAVKWLNDMVANGARFYPKNRAIVEAVSRNEVTFGLVNHYYNYQEVASNGDAQRSANHAFASGDDGGLMIMATAAILDRSKNYDSANKLIAHLLSNGQQRYLTDSVYEYPLAIGVEPSSVLPPTPIDAVGAVDINDIAAEFRRTIEIIEVSGILDQ